MALGRYNGSRGRPEYPNAVFAARSAWESRAACAAQRDAAYRPCQAFGAAPSMPSSASTRSTVSSTISSIVSAGDRTPAAAGRRSPPISVTRRHVAQVREVERRLAHHQHQAAPLLQHDVGGAREQVVRQAVGDRRERLHRARRDDHRLRRERAARRSPRRCRPGCRRRSASASSALAVEAELVVDVEHAGRRRRRGASRSRRARSRSQQAHAVDRAGGAGDADDDAARWPSVNGVSAMPSSVLQLAGLVHLHHDVRAADELAVDVELRDRRPVGVVLDALADSSSSSTLTVFRSVDAAGLQDLDGAAGEAAHAGTAPCPS